METVIENKIDFEKKVKTIIAYKLKVDENEINPLSNFVIDLDADFLGLVDLVMEFEKEFDISIPDGQIEKIITLNEAVENIRTYEKQKMLNRSGGRLNGAYI